MIGHSGFMVNADNELVSHYKNITTVIARWNKDRLIMPALQSYSLEQAQELAKFITNCAPERRYVITKEFAVKPVSVITEGVNIGVYPGGYQLNAERNNEIEERWGTVVYFSFDDDPKSGYSVDGEGRLIDNIDKKDARLVAYWKKGSLIIAGTTFSADQVVALTTYIHNTMPEKRYTITKEFDAPPLVVIYGVTRYNLQDADIMEVWR
jgi:hypothetical protein